MIALLKEVSVPLGSGKVAGFKCDYFRVFCFVVALDDVRLLLMSLWFRAISTETVL